jgi:flagellar basal-body rod protein FlgB
MLNRITNQLDFNAEALKLRSERQRVLASNIANADTPGYQARDINFRDALRDATSHILQRDPSNAARQPADRPAATHAGHITGSTGTAAGSASLLYRMPTQAAFDSNTVDVDRETANLAENTLKYEATLRFLNGQIKSMNLAINGQ